MHIKKLFFLQFSFLFYSFVAAQNDAAQLIFHHLTEKDGLSNNIVNSIIKDRNGFMWIATFDGLNRFDGTHFISFRNNRNQLNSLIHNTVHGICVDEHNDIWCATQTGLSCFHQETEAFDVFYPDSAHANSSYLDVVCDAWGTIWCTGNFGLFEYLPQTRSFKHYGTTGPPGQSLSADAMFKRGLALSPDKKSLWLASIKGINHFDIATKTVYNYKYNPESLEVFDSVFNYPVSFDRTGKLLFGKASAKTLMQYDFESDSLTELDILFIKKINSRASAACIFADKDNRYWISTWGYSSILYDPLTKTVQEFYNEKDFPFSVSGDFFWDAIQDEEGTVWLGTVNGLSYTNPNQAIYKLYQPLKNLEKGIPSSFLNHYIEENKNSWWFTRNSRTTLYQYSPSDGGLHLFKLSEDSFDILGMTRIKNYLLLNTTAGLYSFNMMTGHEEELPGIAELKKFVGIQPVYCARIRGDSVICLLTERKGIIQYNLHTHMLKSVSLNESSFLKRNIYNSSGCTLSANGEKFYLAFTPLKLASYDVSTNQLDSLPISLNNKIKLPEGTLVNLTEDATGNLWLTINATGLVYYDLKKKETKLWQQSDGLAFNLVFQTAMDAHGKLWISAYNKFSLFDPSKEKFENFTLPISENNYGYTSRLINLSNGNILGNIGQTFIEWLPEKTSMNTTGLPVLLNRLILGDSVVWLKNKKEIVLNHTQNNLTFEFGILTGLEKSRFRLQYKLEGFNDHWITAGAENTAVYTNVPEKKFVFRVRAVSADNSWEGKETTLGIRVVPPFYRTFWFKILVAFLFASLIAWVIRLRISSIRRTEKQKHDFNKMINEWRLKALRAQMNPHFIFNVMNSIDLYILKNDAEIASRYLNKFAKLVRLILSQSNDMYVPLGKEIEMLKYYIELELLRFDNPFTFTIRINDDLNPEETEIPSMLLQPYVENAILHGLRHKEGNGILKILLSRRDNILFCVIEDDGVGRKRSAAINATRTNRHVSRGSQLAEERLKDMHARPGFSGGENKNRKPEIAIIDLADANGNACGTRVEISIPVGFDY